MLEYWHVDVANDHPFDVAVSLHRRLPHGLDRRVGQGTSTERAIAAALHRPRLAFATSADDREAVTAGFRGKTFVLAIEGDQLRFEGLR